MGVKARKRINLDMQPKLNTLPSNIFISHVIWVRLLTDLKSNCFRDYPPEWAFLRRYLASTANDSY